MSLSGSGVQRCWLALAHASFHALTFLSLGSRAKVAAASRAARIGVHRVRVQEGLLSKHVAT
jgi:hypothetical protein